MGCGVLRRNTMSNNGTKERMTFSFTPELCARLKAIPEGRRTMQVENLLRPQVGLLPLILAYRDPAELAGLDGKKGGAA